MGPRRVFSRTVPWRSSTIASDATLRPRARRQQQMNLRPALMRLGPDLAVMVRSDLATDRQPHAGTTELRLRSEEHTSELQSLMRISYAVFFLKKKTQTHLYYHIIAATTTENNQK